MTQSQLLLATNNSNNLYIDTSDSLASDWSRNDLVARVNAALKQLDESNFVPKDAIPINIQIMKWLISTTH